MGGIYDSFSTRVGRLHVQLRRRCVPRRSGGAFCFAHCRSVCSVIKRDDVEVE
jgi:hypothetical protein